VKKSARGKSIKQSTLRTDRKELLAKRRKRDGGGKLEFLTAGSSSPVQGSARKLSIHFPEGGVITLTFQLARREARSRIYTIDTYQLTDIDPIPPSTCVTSYVNNLN